MNHDVAEVNGSDPPMLPGSFLYEKEPGYEATDPPPKRKGGSGKYSTSSHYGLAVAMDSAKSQTFEVSCWASVNWRVC